MKKSIFVLLAVAILVPILYATIDVTSASIIYNDNVLYFSGMAYNITATDVQNYDIFGFLSLLKDGVEQSSTLQIFLINQSFPSYFFISDSLGTPSSGDWKTKFKIIWYNKSTHVKVGADSAFSEVVEINPM